jgi:hypothetical protein
MNHIVNSIKSTLTGIDGPCIIYVGVGTFAGLITDTNNGRILENQNYHQFPPTLQDIYKKNKDMHLIIVLIDPLQEDPIYMATDNNLIKNLFDNNPWHCIQDKNLELYINDRISVYTFRKNVYTQASNYHNTEGLSDITEDLRELNTFSIQNDITFIYHDFTGRDTYKDLNVYFKDLNTEHCDQIIYGIGNGFFTGCYFDMSDKKSHLATIIEYKKKKVIKVFNLKHIINQYNLKYQNINNFPIDMYFSLVLEKYGFEQSEQIYGQIEKMLEDFKYNFKNYSIYLLRKVKEFNERLSEGIPEQEDDNFCNSYYYFNNMPKYVKTIIEELYKTKDINIFTKCIDIIADVYEKELNFITLNSELKNYSSVQILNYITSNPDKYKWFDAFDSFNTITV